MQNTVDSCQQKANPGSPIPSSEGTSFFEDDNG